MGRIAKWLFELSKSRASRGLPPAHIRPVPFLISTILLSISTAIMVWFHYYDNAVAAAVIKFVETHREIFIATAVIQAFVIAPIMLFTFKIGSNVVSISRTEKYWVVIFFLAIFTTINTYRVYAHFKNSEGIQEFFVVLFGLSLIFLIITQLLSYALFRDPMLSPGRYQRWAWRHLHWLAPAGFAIAFLFGVGVLAFPALILRFTIGERLRQHPFLFLRSFRTEKTDVIYSKIIAEPCSKRGVVVAVVHDKQIPGEINHAAHYIDWAYALVMDEESLAGRRASQETWKQQIAQLIPACTGVIIETSIMTESITWELNEAVKLIAHKKIVFLQNTVTEPSKIEDKPEHRGVLKISYALDKKSLKLAKKKFSAWLKSL